MKSSPAQSGIKADWHFSFFQCCNGAAFPPGLAVSGRATCHNQFLLFLGLGIKCNLIRPKNVLKNETENMTVFVLKPAKLFDDQGVFDGSQNRFEDRGFDQSSSLPVTHREKKGTSYQINWKQLVLVPPLEMQSTLIACSLWTTI